MPTIKHVTASYDPETCVWWAESDDFPGLVSEAPTFEALIERTSAAAGELLSMAGASLDQFQLEFTTTRLIELA